MPDWIPFLLVCLVAFFSGALPFSVWLGRLFVRRDVRDLGDHNPGAMNAFRTGHFWFGLTVLLLDVTKGVLPVIYARLAWGYADWRLVAVGVLPVLGHAFSPFLKFKGGKALSVTLGVWIGLTLWKIPLIAVAVIVLAKWRIKPDAWVVVLALSAMGLGILLWVPDAWLFLCLLLQCLVILWKHRDELLEHPRWKRKEETTGHGG